MDNITMPPGTVPPPTGQPPAPVNPVVPMEPKFFGPIELLKQAWHIYKTRFWVLIGIYIIPAALIIGVGALAGAGFVAGGLLGIKASPALLIAAVVLAVLVYLAVIYISLWSQAALLFAVKGAEQRVGFKESFKLGSHKVFSILGAALLVELAVCGLMLVGGAVIFALYAVLPKIPALFFVEGLLVLILALWVIKLLVEFSLASYVVVGDNARALSAIQRSRDYVKGRWWSVFGRVLFLIILALVYIIVLILVNAVFKAIPGVGGQILSVIVSLVLEVILPPLFVAYLYQLYANLRAIKGESQIPADKKSTGLIILAVILIVGVFVLIPIILLALNGARAKSRDAVRMADVRGMAASLQLYYSDYNSYPENLSNLTPKYFLTLPTAPMPADGSCTAEQNTFQYTFIDSSHYVLTFCLGAATAGYPAGPNVLTQSGIDYGQPSLLH